MRASSPLYYTGSTTPRGSLLGRRLTAFIFPFPFRGRVDARRVGIGEAADPETRSAPPCYSSSQRRRARAARSVTQNQNQNQNPRKNRARPNRNLPPRLAFDPLEGSLGVSPRRHSAFLGPKTVSDPTLETNSLRPSSFLFWHMCMLFFGVWKICVAHASHLAFPVCSLQQGVMPASTRSSTSPRAEYRHNMSPLLSCSQCAH